MKSMVVSSIAVTKSWANNAFGVVGNPITTRVNRCCSAIKLTSVCDRTFLWIFFDFFQSDVFGVRSLAICFKTV